MEPFIHLHNYITRPIGSKAMNAIMSQLDEDNNISFIHGSIFLARYPNYSEKLLKIIKKSYDLKFNYNIGDIILNNRVKFNAFKIVRITECYYICTYVDENIYNKIFHFKKNHCFIWIDDIKICKYCKTKLTNKNLPYDWTCVDDTKKDGYVCDLCVLKWPVKKNIE